MSVQTQIDRIQNAVNTQADIIGQIAEALACKAAAGTDDGTLSAIISRTITEITVLPGTDKIGAYAFCLCADLAKVTLPTSLTNIDQQAFNGCKALSAITIPGGVTNIGNYAFYNCSLLASISLPSGLKTLGANAFGNCKGLTRVTFQGTPDSIQATSFNLCTNIAHIYVPWAEGAVANAPWGATNAAIHYGYAG